MQACRPGGSKADGVAVPQDGLGRLGNAGLIMKHQAGQHAIGAFPAAPRGEDDHLGRLAAPRP
jgi:hypothetical protein